MAVANASVRRLSEQQRQVLEGWLLEFDQGWAEGLLNERASRLPPPPLRLPALAELVKIDLEHQWRSGRHLPLGDYLRRFPELGDFDSVPADLIQAEYEVRKQFGDTADLADFGRRFPRQAEALARLLAEERAVVTDAELARPEGDTKWTHGTPPVSGSRSVPTDLSGQFGRYRIEKRLGKGGMGSVYLAYDPQLDRPVALKVPHFGPEDGPEVRERFYREARAAATLDHPNICPVYDVGEVGGVPYLTMAYVEGKPLAAFLQGGKPVVTAQAVAVVRILALALQEAHARGVIHRDLKPANVLINARKEPVLMDFGLARRVNKEEVRLTQKGAILGTPAYMSPEQVGGDPDAVGPRSDVYSLGVILYQLLTGRLPFEGDLMTVLAQIVGTAPPPPSSIRPGFDARLEAVCLRAMAKKPEDRYASMADLARDLGEYLRDAAPPDAGKPAGAPPRRRRWVAVAAASAGAALLLGILIIITTKRGTVTVHVDEPDARVEIKTASDAPRPAGPKTAAVPAAPGQPVDLLKLMDIKEQFLAAGQVPWQFEDGALSCRPNTIQFPYLFPEGPGIVEVPYVPPEEYRLELTVWRYGAVDALSVALPVRGHSTWVVLDGWFGKFSGFSALDGRAALNNESTHAGKVLQDGQANTIVCTVRRDAVQVSCNGQAVIDWQGDPGRLSLLGPALPVGRVLYLSSHSSYRVTRLLLTPLAGEGHRIEDPAPEVRRLPGGHNTVAFTPDGRRLVFHGGRFPRCWDVDGAREVWRGDGFWKETWRVAVAPDGRRFLTAGADGSLRLWDAATGQDLYHLPNQGASLLGLAFAPDGRTAAAGAVDGTVRLWPLPDPGAGGKRFWATHGLRAEYFEGTNLGKKVGEGVSYQFDWQRDRTAPHPALPGEFYSVRWTGWLKAPRPGKYTLTLSADDGVRLWLDEKLLIDEWHGGKPTPYPAEVTLTDQPHRLKIEYFQGSFLAYLMLHWSQAGGFAEREVPAEALFLNEADARKAEVKLPAALRRFDGHRGKVWSVAFSPDGKRLLTGGADRTVRVWDVATGMELRRFEGHTADVRAVTFSPDGKNVASAGMDQDVRVWDANTGDEVCCLRGHRGGVTSVAFTPDGRRLLSGSEDGTLRLWDLKAKKSLDCFRGHTNHVLDVAVSPGGRRAASASWDGTIRVWRLPP